MEEPDQQAHLQVEQVEEGPEMVDQEEMLLDQPEEPEV